MKTFAAWPFLAALCSSLMWAPSAASPPEIIAHRGASHDAPENTLAAVKLGWAQDSDAVEIDIHLSRDGRIVAIHDADTKRTGSRDHKVAGQTLAELRQLDAGSWKGAAWAGEKIPTLDEILPTIPSGKRLFIEIKCGPEVLPELERVLKAAARQAKETLIIGFSLETMRQAKARFPELEVYWLSSFEQDKQTGQWSPAAETLIRSALEAKLDGLNLKAQPEVLDAAFVQKIRSAGLKFYVWTVDDPGLAKRMAALGVDGITTNRPEWLRQRLSE